MKRQFVIRAIVLAMLLMLIPAAPLAAAPRCFPDTAGVSACIDGRIRTFWERNGGLAVFGFPLASATEQASDDGPITVQMFERARIEVHPRQRAPYDVQLGRLGFDALVRRGEAPAAPDQPRAGCRFFTATNQNICSPFLDTWRRYGLDLGQPGVSEAESLALFGLPLGPAHVEQLGDGTSAMIQWFERARFEDHGAQGVLLGLLGRELGAKTETALPVAPVSIGDRGGFVVVNGDQFTRLGQTIQLKGVNYYPQGRPWAEMWQYWDGVQAERELRQARDQLGINTIRVLLPYDISTSGKSAGKVTPEILRSLRELLQVAGSLNIRVIIALFDFYNGFPPPGSLEEQDHIAYLETLIGNFVGDDRIIAWDVHNEPDHYGTWKEEHADRVLLWLGRMADTIHRLAPNHLVTVGMGEYQSFWRIGPDGRRPVDYIDFVSLHNYNAADAARQLDELRTYTKKPIVIGEFGWPTGPMCAVPGYTEAQQAWVYRETLRQSAGRVAGVIGWTLRDYDPLLTTRWETREEFYGLVRPNGTLKPAADALRDYPAAALPSVVTTNLPLTTVEPKTAGDKNAPQIIQATGHSVKGPFRRAWLLLGGQSSFGAPIAEAFIRESERGPMVVQYFEAAVLEIPVGLAVDPGSLEQLQIDILRASMRVQALGEIYVGAVSAGDRGQYFAAGAHKIGNPFQNFYRVYRGQWRFGSAISEPFSEIVNGVPTVVQYFQFGRLEVNAATGNIEASRFGRRAYDDLCRANGQ